MPGPNKAVAAQKEIPLMNVKTSQQPQQQEKAVEQTMRDSFNEDNADGLGLMSHIRNETREGPSAEMLKRAKGASAVQVVPFRERSLFTENAGVGVETKPQRSIFSYMMPSFFRKRDPGAAYLRAQMYGDLSVLQQRAQDTVNQMDNNIAKQNAIIARRMRETQRIKSTRGIG
jgi:hypothetical protein